MVLLTPHVDMSSICSHCSRRWWLFALSRFLRHPSKKWMTAVLKCLLRAAQSLDETPFAVVIPHQASQRRHVRLNEEQDPGAVKGGEPNIIKHRFDTYDKSSVYMKWHFTLGSKFCLQKRDWWMQTFLRSVLVLTSRKEPLKSEVLGLDHAVGNPLFKTLGSLTG